MTYACLFNHAKPSRFLPHLFIYRAAAPLFGNGQTTVFLPQFVLSEVSSVVTWLSPAGVSREEDHRLRLRHALCHEGAQEGHTQRSEMSGHAVRRMLGVC